MTLAGILRNICINPISTRTPVVVIVRVPRWRQCDLYGLCPICQLCHRSISVTFSILLASPWGLRSVVRDVRRLLWYLNRYSPKVNLPVVMLQIYELNFFLTSTPMFHSITSVCFFSTQTGSIISDKFALVRFHATFATSPILRSVEVILDNTLLYNNITEIITKEYAITNEIQCY